VCVSSFRYLACKSHAPYCHLRPVRLYHIFPHYLINVTIFGWKVIKHRTLVLTVSASFVWNVSHSKNYWVRYHKYTVRHVKYSLFWSDINVTWIFPADFRKILNKINFMYIHRVGAEKFHTDGRTDRQTDIKKLIVAFCNSANALNSPDTCAISLVLIRPHTDTETNY
jgi:hypothetical protein